MEALTLPVPQYIPWNKGKLVGPKPPLKLQEIWAIRIRLQLSRCVRDLALFKLALDSKLRGCDLVALRVSDITIGTGIVSRATVFQRKTQRPVQFELTEQTRTAVSIWIATKRLKLTDYLFPSRQKVAAHLSTRQYGRLVDKWIKSIGLDDAGYGTHDASHQADPHISADQEPARYPAPASPHEARKHGTLSGYRGRRRPGDG